MSIIKITKKNITIEFLNYLYKNNIGISCKNREIEKSLIKQFYNLNILDECENILISPLELYINKKEQIYKEKTYWHLYKEKGVYLIDKINNKLCIKYIKINKNIEIIKYLGDSSFF